VAIEVLIPKLGLTMEYGLIEEWLVAPGTQVEPGDPLLRLATDKVDVEVEAEGSGLFHPVVESGAELPPGALIGWLLEAGEELPAAVAGTAPAPQAPAPTGRLFSSPNARRIARERGIDIAGVNGTGPGGRIITADVLDAAAAQPTAPETPAARP
jgi:pyruvate/2-oxoglutarate dehydrogenase complex dihydrolipoamide acyltransferase (E2) component